MQHLTTISTTLLFFSTFAAAQLVTLPECVQTCLHNVAPQCSGLKCYCGALDSTSLVSAAACYHSLCDSTSSDPFDIFMADVGPLCFQNDVPIRQDQVAKAQAVESATTFATYLSLSDPAPAAAATTISAAVASGASAVVMMATTSAAGSGGVAAATSTGSALFASNTRLPFGVVAPSTTAISTGGAAKGIVGRDARDGVVVGLVLGLAGMLLQVAG